MYLNHGDEIKCIMNYMKKEKTKLIIMYDINRITIRYNDYFEIIYGKTENAKLPVRPEPVKYLIYKKEQITEEILFYKLLELYDNTKWRIFYKRVQRSYFVKKHQLLKFGEERVFPDYKELYYDIYNEKC